MNGFRFHIDAAPEIRKKLMHNVRPVKPVTWFCSVVHGQVIPESSMPKLSVKQEYPDGDFENDYVVNIDLQSPEDQYGVLDDSNDCAFDRLTTESLCNISEAIRENEGSHTQYRVIAYWNDKRIAEFAMTGELYQCVKRIDNGVEEKIQGGIHDTNICIAGKKINCSVLEHYRDGVQAVECGSRCSYVTEEMKDRFVLWNELRWHGEYNTVLEKGVLEDIEKSGVLAKDWGDPHKIQREPITNAPEEPTAEDENQFS